MPMTRPVFGLLLIAFSLAPGQWLETVIWLPDTTSMPSALCYNPQNNKVYCANFGADNVTVIDGASNSVITSVPVGHYPSALCYNPQNNKAYCANRTCSDNVTVIEGATNAIITTGSV
ncbi:MAG: YncE family protein, partial [candidate division WOR-3 bacterium]|nr:YncE family protein [candidate division WOR-3 bacterium]